MKGDEDNVGTWMPVYIGDLTADTQDLSPEEFGIYLRLLLQMWTRGGTIPSDPQRLSRLAGCDATTLDRVWPRIGGFFSAPTDGSLTQKRLALELGRARQVRLSTLEKAQKGGVASGATRRARSQVQAEDEPGVQAQSEAESNLGMKLAATPSPSPSPSPEPGPLPEESRALARTSPPSAYSMVVAVHGEAWRGQYGEPYMPTGQDKSHLGRVLKSFRDRAAINAYPWRAVMANYLEDTDRFVAGVHRHSLAYFCSCGGLNKYRVEERLAGLTDKSRGNVATTNRWLAAKGG